MAFYEELSRYYDIVFPFKATIYGFLTRHFKKQGAVLDIATGTGNYALALAKDGYDVTAIDLDSQMIDALSLKANKEDIHLKSQVMNMLDLSQLTANTFDGAFCIGNSLVHLQTPKDILSALKEIHTLLKDKGQLIIQIVNYDRILARDIKDLPLIHRPEHKVKFIRKYELVDGLVEFKTRLIVGEKDDLYDNRITLYPLTCRTLKSLLETAGFKDIKHYGNFNGDEFTLDAFPLIVTAEK